jgi:hypothetical protein
LPEFCQISVGVNSIEVRTAISDRNGQQVFSVKRSHWMTLQPCRQPTWLKGGMPGLVQPRTNGNKKGPAQEELRRATLLN